MFQTRHVLGAIGGAILVGSLSAMAIPTQMNAIIGEDWREAIPHHPLPDYSAFVDAENARSYQQAIPVDADYTPYDRGSWMHQAIAWTEPAPPPAPPELEPDVSAAPQPVAIDAPQAPAATVQVAVRTGVASGTATAPSAPLDLSSPARVSVKSAPQVAQGGPRVIDLSHFAPAAGSDAVQANDGST